MPNLTNNMSGQELINEVNHSIDERGKNGVDGAAQTINSDLKINGKLQAGEAVEEIENDEQFISGKIVVPDLYLNNDISLKEFINNINTFLLSDANVIRNYQTGETNTSVITMKSFKFLESSSNYKDPSFPLRYTKSFKYDISKEGMPDSPTFPTSQNYITLYPIDVVVRAYNGRVYATGLIKYRLYKDNIFIKEKETTLESISVEGSSGYKYNYTRLDRFSSGKLFIGNPSGNYSIEIDVDITLNKSSWSAGTDYTFYIGTDITSLGEENMGTPSQEYAFLKYTYEQRYVEPIVID